MRMRSGLRFVFVRSWRIDCTEYIRIRSRYSEGLRWEDVGFYVLWFERVMLGSEGFCIRTNYLTPPPPNTGHPACQHLIHSSFQELSSTSPSLTSPPLPILPPKNNVPTYLPGLA